MKTEINLRPKGFAISGSFYWPRVFSILMVLIFIISVITGTVFIHLYQINLKSEITLLTSDKVDFEVKAAPVEELERELRGLKSRSSLKRQMEGEAIFWSAYMIEIDNRAVDGGIYVEQMNCLSDGKITIRGWSRSMERIASYTQELEETDFLNGVMFTGMSSADNRVTFEITVPAADGG